MPDQVSAGDGQVPAAQQPQPSAGSAPGTGVQGRPSVGNRRLALAAAALLVIIGAVAAVPWLLGKVVSAANPFDENRIDRTGPAVLNSLSDLGSYHAAAGYYEVVIDQETGIDNLPSFLAGERVLFVAAGTVEATVDFESLDEGAITIDEERRSATITLPAVTLADPRLDLDASYVANRDRGLRERLQEALGDGTEDGELDTAALYKEAEVRLAAAGERSDELRARAEENTRSMLTSLLGELGYTDVTVTFSESANPS